MCLQVPAASYLPIHGQKLCRRDAISEGRSGRGVEMTRNRATMSYSGIDAMTKQGGQSEACPPLLAVSGEVGTARCAFAHPTSLRRHDHLADRPQRDAGKLEVSPGERDPDDRHGQNNRGDEVAEREPPAG